MKALLAPRTKRTLLIVGVTLIVGSGLGVIALLTGLMPLPDTLFAGESTLHSIVRLSVIGCLLAAIGSLE